MPMNLTTLRNALSDFGHLVNDQIVSEVPEDLAICEFDCRESQCSSSKWVSCERRISAAARKSRPAATQSECAHTIVGVEGTRRLGDAACLVSKSRVCSTNSSRE